MLYALPCYFSQLDDDSFAFTNNLVLNKEYLTTAQPVENIRFTNSGCAISLINSKTPNESIFNASYNSVILSNTATFDDKVQILHVNYFTYEANKLILSCEYTVYNISRISASAEENTITYETKLSNLRAHDGLIEYGIAYDSIVGSDGKLNISNTCDSDLYLGDNLDANIMMSREKLIFKCCESSTGFDKLSDSKLSDVAWCYVYMQPGHYETDDTQLSMFNFDLPVTQFYSYDYETKRQKELTINSNMGIIAFPIYRQENENAIRVRWDSTGEGVVASSYAYKIFTQYFTGAQSKIYGIKISAIPPFVRIKNNNYSVIETSTGDSNIVLTYDPSDYGWEAKQTGAIEGSNSCLFVIKRLNITAHETHPISLDSLRSNGYPRGLVEDYVYAASELGTIDSPYIQAHTQKLVLSNGVSSSYEMHPLLLGGIYNGLEFEVYETFTADITKCFVTPNAKKLVNSPFKEINMKAYNGLLADSDMSYPFTVSQLDTFLANNKNFYSQKFIGRATSVFNMGLSALTAKNEQQALATTASSGMKIMVDMAQQSLTLDNYANATANLSNASGNLYLNLGVDTVGYYLEHWKADSQQIKAYYAEFKEKGIKLQKHISANETNKYLSITNKRFDKSSYKYVSGDFNLIVDSVLHTYRINKLNNIIKNGFKILSHDDTTDSVIQIDSNYINSAYLTINEGGFK